MPNKAIPTRYFVIDWELDPVDFKEVNEAEFNATEGSITQERHTIWANGVDQVCFYKGLDVC